MGEYVKVAKVGDVPKGRGLAVQVAGKQIGLFNLGGSIHAIDDVCTHADASLCEGDVSGDEVVCPLHFATFDIKTGQCTGPPAAEDVTSYRVRVDGDDVEIELQGP